MSMAGENQDENATGQDEAGAPGAGNGLRAWLEVLDHGLAALERAAWQGRSIAGRAARARDSLERGTAELAAEAARWPARLSRLSRAGWMLTRVTASYRLWGTRSAFIPESRQEAALEKLHRTNARRFRETSLEQGGAFLKIGQLLSSRPDLLPRAWVEELEVLQDQARPESFETLRAQIEAELGRPVEELFAELDPEPLASASIGQVHRARLTDGRQVAVKIRRPGLEEVVELDMGLLALFLESIRSLLPPVDLDTITAELQRTIRAELDYHQEAVAMAQVRHCLADRPGVRVPAPVPELCTHGVLVAEFIEGRRMTAVLDELQEAGEHQRLAELLARLLDCYFKQVLEGGVFQSDPHPGNLLVTPAGELVLLDFGSSMALPERFRRGYYRILQASIVNEEEEIARVLTELGFATRSGHPDTLLAYSRLLLDQLNEALLSGTDPGGIDWPSTTELISQGLGVLRQTEDDPVETVPAEFIMLGRVFASLGGLFLHYRPQLDMAAVVMPYLTRPLDEPRAA